MQQTTHDPLFLSSSFILTLAHVTVTSQITVTPSSNSSLHAGNTNLANQAAMHNGDHRNINGASSAVVSSSLSFYCTAFSVVVGTVAYFMY